MANDQSVVLWKHLKRFAEQFMGKVNGSVYPTIKAGTYGTDNEELFEDTVTENSKKGVQSGAVYTALAAKQDTLTIDNAPTEDSANPVASGGVYTAIGAVAGRVPECSDSTDGTFVLKCVVASGVRTYQWVSE